MLEIKFAAATESAGIKEVLALFFDRLVPLSPVHLQAWRSGAEQAEGCVCLHWDSSLSKADLQGLGSQQPVQVSCTWLDTQGGVKAEQRALVQPQRLRRELKRQLYLLLAAGYQSQWPWGSLTGIRPTQICLEVWQAQAASRDAALQELCQHWGLSPAKASKGLQTALAEQELLDSLPLGERMVYAGIPFCPGRCSYCSFISRDALRQAEHLSAYTTAMIQEARAVFADLQTPVAAFYLGGGTPTSLSDYDFARLLSALLEVIPFSPGAELTVEAGRADTINAAKLACMRSLGISRLCINPQSMRSGTLERVGRLHTVAAVQQAYQLARSFGFDDINMDLILGLPGDSPSDFLYSVDELLKLEPESITLHTLALKRSARLDEEAAQHYLALRYPDPELAAALQTAETKLQSQDYQAYYLYRQKNVRGGLENTGFCRPGKACKYNVAMMSDQVSIIGLGSGASSKKVQGRKVERLHNSKDLLDYMQRLPEFIRQKLSFFAE